jgi:tetratricopeptide (TPR) repeat protein
LSRVSSDAGLPMKAERVLRTVLAGDEDRYDARRMLATVLLSQHRFREAIREAERCLQMRQNDAWTHGVIGDARMELGDYDGAFAAFDRMMKIRPDAASYARVSYARELRGDLSSALRLMTMALEATGPNDPESLAWHHAQIGGLFLAQGRLDAAAREYAHAEFAFPGHPFAIEGLARVEDARGRPAAALALIDRALVNGASPSLLAYSASLLRKLGRTADAFRRQSLAEAAWRSDAPEPARLALLLADSGDAENIREAVDVARRAASERDDIHTNDALAWAYYRAGELELAKAASARAMRTGTVDRALITRARSIERAGAAAHAGAAR